MFKKFLAGEVDALALANRQQHNIRINQQFTLECGIPRTVPEVPIIWLKNGARFVSPDQNRVQVNPRSIIFSPVQTVDTGRYTCMAIDNSASFTSALNVMAAGARGDYFNQNRYICFVTLLISFCYQPNASSS